MKRPAPPWAKHARPRPPAPSTEWCAGPETIMAIAAAICTAAVAAVWALGHLLALIGDF